jgi:hypothetical protein
MTTNTLVRLSAAIEFATGVAVIADPGFVVREIFGVGISSGGAPLGRLAGFGLLTLGLACWPPGDHATPQATHALFIYNLLAGVYLGYLRVGGGFVSFLLWPACALHVTLALLMARPAFQTGSKVKAAQANGQ